MKVIAFKWQALEKKVTPNSLINVVFNELEKEG